MMTKPIGIFDSGVGGTSILEEIHALLPNENIIYLADSINAPYGDRTSEAIKALSVKNTEFLLTRECKIIVVACNTATTNAIASLRSQYDIPFVGIEPAIKPAALQTKTNTVGILATKGTLSSSLFHKTSNLFASDIEVIEQIGEGIVRLIEDGKLESQDMVDLLKIYLDPMITANIDYLVLGCTHYSYLIPILKKLLPKSVTIIDSGEAVARQTKHLLIENRIVSTSSDKGIVSILTNGDPEIIKSITRHKYPVTKERF